jgi:hypothetical protein
MAICGIARIEDIARSHVTRHPFAEDGHAASLFCGGTRTDPPWRSSL